MSFWLLPTSYSLHRRVGWVQGNPQPHRLVENPERLAAKRSLTQQNSEVQQEARQQQQENVYRVLFLRYVLVIFCSCYGLSDWLKRFFCMRPMSNKSHNSYRKVFDWVNFMLLVLFCRHSLSTFKLLKVVLKHERALKNMENNKQGKLIHMCSIKFSIHSNSFIYFFIEQNAQLCPTLSLKKPKRFSSSSYPNLRNLLTTTKKKFESGLLYSKCMLFFFVVATSLLKNWVWNREIYSCF